MNSPLGWLGGKKLLRKEVIKRFPAAFERYIEVFGGAGWVLFASDRHAEMEIYNDINNDLVTMYRCIKCHYAEVQRELENVINSRVMFEEYKQQLHYEYLTDIQRAARFFYMVSFSYGCDARSFGCRSRGIINAVEYLGAVSKRLEMVIIEHKGYEELIKMYDRPNALLYCDPPYYGAEREYEYKFTADDHLKLCEVLKSIKGKFILSYNDCGFVRELYDGFRIEEVERNSNLTGRYNTNRVYKELLVKNY